MSATSLERLIKDWEGSWQLLSSSTHRAVVVKAGVTLTLYFATSRDCREFAERVSDEREVLDVMAGPVMQATNGPIRVKESEHDKDVHRDATGQSGLQVQRCLKRGDARERHRPHRPEYDA